MSVFLVGAFSDPAAGDSGKRKVSFYDQQQHLTASRSIIRKHETSRLFIRPIDLHRFIFTDSFDYAHPSFSRHPHLITERFRRTAPLFL